MRHHATERCAAYQPSGPLAAQQAGVAMVHQELTLADELTVAENITLSVASRAALAWVRGAAVGFMLPSATALRNRRLI